jgi:hypothetical protein
LDGGLAARCCRTVWRRIWQGQDAVHSTSIPQTLGCRVGSIEPLWRGLRPTCFEPRVGPNFPYRWEPLLHGERTRALPAKRLKSL